MPQRTLGLRYCPRHEHEIWYCSRRCMRAREAFRASTGALRVYWNQRKNGATPCRNPEHPRNCSQHCAAPESAVL